MKKRLAPLCASLLLFAICAWAADFWTAKPYTDWNDKEVTQVYSNSPWAKQLIATVSMAADDSASKSRGGKGGNRGGDSQGGQESTVLFTIRWQSALPIKQALMKKKYGPEAATSADVKKILESSEPVYVVVLSGLRLDHTASALDQTKRELLSGTRLVIKGKEPIKPVDFRLAGDVISDAVFAFPKTIPIVEDDKEVEFQCMLTTGTIRQKFRLKDMLFNGKLEL